MGDNGDRCFKLWFDFFIKEKSSLTKFSNLLHKKDTYFLNHPLELDFDNELYEKVYPSGFLEKDFQEILLNENPKDIYYKTRLSLAINKELDFNLIKERIGVENFYSILEKTIIDAHYEKMNVKFEKLVSKAISIYGLPRDRLVDIAFLRGVNLGSRYPDKESENNLKKTLIINKIKTYIGF